MKFDIKRNILYLLFISYLIFYTFFGYNIFSNKIINLIHPIALILLFLYAFFIMKTFKQRIRQETGRIQTIFIIVTIYLMIYFSLGLITGYGRSIYNHSILGYIQNIWIYIIPVICIEYLRNMFVKNNSNKWIYILTIILFTLYNIPLYSFIKSEYSIAELFTKICSIVVPALATSIVLTYVSKTSGYKSTIAYLVPQKIFMISLPLLPNLDWYYVAVTGTLLPFITYVFIKSIQDKLTDLIAKRNYEKQSFIRNIPIIFIIVLLLCFMTGIFKYEPVAILSNSMHPLYNRGDVVIIEKINNTALNNLKEQDIIDYSLYGIYVSHRIVSVEKHNDGTVLYTTKGDNNNIIDKEKVSPDQIKGVVIFTVSKIGYPAVWFSELFNKKKADIETGS